MLSLLRRSFARPTSPVRRPSHRLRLEALEARHCPAPVVSNLSVTQAMGHSVNVTGNVQDQFMGGMRVNVSGVGYGQGGLNSDGSFNLMVNASSVGTLTVTATNMQNQTSSPVSVSMVNYAPGLVLCMEYLPHKQVRLFGSVSDEVVTTVAVRFSGMVTGSAPVGSDGSFSYTATPTGLGDVQVRAVDQWQLESGTQTKTITNSAPVVNNFEVVDDPTLGWHAEGSVTDESAPGLTLTVTDPNGNVLATPTCDLDGYFSTKINLAPGMHGSVTAVTTDWWGLQSNVAWVTVST